MQSDCRPVSRCKTHTSSEGHGEPTRGTTLELHWPSKEVTNMHFDVIPKVFEVNEPIFHIFALNIQHDWPSIGPMVRGCLASVVHLIAVPNQVKDSVRLLVLDFCCIRCSGPPFQKIRKSFFGGDQNF